MGTGWDQCFGLLPKRACRCGLGLGLFQRQLWSAWLLGAVFSAQDRFELGFDENLFKSTVFAGDR
jgi:hypothetical protein